MRIPFEGKEIIGYLRLPKNAKGPVPLVIAVNGLDSRKEDLTESFGAILPFGIGYLAVDGPGTGQDPIKVSETADRMLSRVIDYAQSRPEIDKNRIAMHGVSWGAYWATKMAIVERARLRGCSAQSPPVDKFFQKEFLMNSLLGNREYLFDQVPALMNILEDVHTLDEMADFLPKMSLVHAGTAGQADGAHARSSPECTTRRFPSMTNIYLLLSKGDVPKEAWINPRGGHLGPAGRSVARSADIQASDHSVAGENAGASGELAPEATRDSRSQLHDHCLIESPEHRVHAIAPQAASTRRCGCRC